MTVHQCPRCELRFSGEPELKDHLVVEHDVDPTTIQTGWELRAGIHPHRTPPDPTHAD